MTNAQFSNVHNNAQIWLDNAYPLYKREEVKKIGIPSNPKDLFEDAVNILFKVRISALGSLQVPHDLTGSFTNFHNFSNLTELFLGDKKIDLKSVASFPISLEKLRKLGAVGRANLQTATAIPSVLLSQVLELGWS